MKRAPTKYGNKRVKVGGIKFDSKREAARWQALNLMQLSGLITELARQVPFELAPSIKFDGDARAKPALRYFADFTYFEKAPDAWVYVVEDSKGHKTEAYRIKRHLMLAVHKIQVRETCANG